VFDFETQSVLREIEIPILSMHVGYIGWINHVSLCHFLLFWSFLQHISSCVLLNRQTTTGRRSTSRRSTCLLLFKGWFSMIYLFFLKKNSKVNPSC